MKVWYFYLLIMSQIVKTEMIGPTLPKSVNFIIPLYRQLINSTKLEFANP